MRSVEVCWPCASNNVMQVLGRGRLPVRIIVDASSTAHLGFAGLLHIVRMLLVVRSYSCLDCGHARTWIRVIDNVFVFLEPFLIGAASEARCIAVQGVFGKPARDGSCVQRIVIVLRVVFQVFDQGKIEIVQAGHFRRVLAAV